MLTLALDTSTRAGSVALARGDTIIAAAGGDPARTHGERLPGDLLTLLAEAGVALTAVERFAVAAGPGSFTGLRVGIATVQALALATARRVVPVPTLEATARAGSRGAAAGRPILAWMDGQRGEVFAAVYDVPGPGEVRRLLAGPRVGTPAALLDAWAPSLADRPLAVIGNGVATARSLLEARLEPGTCLVDDLPPLAPALARMAGDPGRDAVAPHAVQPLYVRRPDAVLARARHPAPPSGAEP